MTPAERQAAYRKRHPERVKAARLRGKERDKAWRAANREKINEVGRKWYAANRAKVLALRKERFDSKKNSVRNKEDYQKNKDERLKVKKAWRKANPERCKELKSEWIARNKEYYLARSAEYESVKRAVCRKATPAWANKFFIREAYHLARLRTQATGIKHHVDHIIPLQSDVVCGLHVETNLRVIPASTNIRKSNALLHTDSRATPYGF